MQVQQLIAILATMNPTTEIVVRVGNNHGAVKVNRVEYWTAIPTRNTLDTADMLLPEDRNSGDKKVLVIS